jgi:hypothetical protein
MAKDFLKKHDTKGMTIDRLKELLGSPDSEHDSWQYNLSTNGVPPRGPQTEAVFLMHPQLCVHFKEGVVNEVASCHGLGLADDRKTITARFDANLWRLSGPPERLNMVANLIKSEILKGRDKDEVKQILGNPDAQSETREIEYSLVFRMVDIVTLTFIIGEDGRISDARIIEH